MGEELLETRWRIRDPKEGDLTCRLYLTETGYDVRTEHSVDGQTRTQWARNIEAARTIADRWLVELKESAGGVDELPAQ